MPNVTAVVDASACAEFLLGTPLGELAHRAFAEAGDLHAPHLVIPETLSVLRGWVLGHKLAKRRATIACSDLASMPWQLWDSTPLIPVIWSLRHNLSAYDASYVALAQSLECPLITRDRRLAAAVDDPVRIHLLDR